MAILEYYNGTNWVNLVEPKTITLTGAVTGSGVDTINTILSNSINITGATQNLIFTGNDLATLKLTNSKTPISTNIPVIVDLEFTNAFNGGFKLSQELLSTNTNGVGRFKLDAFNNTGVFTNFITASVDYIAVIQSTEPVININTVCTISKQLALGHNVISLVDLPHHVIKLDNTSNTGKTEFIVARTEDAVKFGFDAAINAGYIDSMLSFFHIMYQGDIGVTFATNGYVGIGTTSPIAPLQFANETANRKIVLWRGLAIDNEDEHRFDGFGLNGGNQLRYQISQPTGAHVFYTGVNATTSNELFRITGEGYVGIATGTPKALLQFGNTLQNRMLVLWENNINQNNHEFCGFGINTDNILRYQIGATTGAHRFYTASSSTTSTELFTILGNGHVGIGIDTPNAPLQFANVTLNRKIVLWEGANNDHQFNGFGLNGGNTIRHQVSTTTGFHTFWAATSDVSSIELLRIYGTGVIGVGIDSANPNSYIKFNNQTVHRKVVLREIADNEHEFDGFGLSNVNSVRYQIGATTGTHTFYAATDSNNSDELFRITGTGFVGIGVQDPHAPLQFQDEIVNRKIVLRETSNNDHEFDGFGLNSANSIRYQIAADTGAHRFYTGTSSTTSTEIFTITGTGNIGIGASTPNAQLQLKNIITNRKIVLWENFNNDHQYNGFGLNTGNVVRYQVADTAGSHRFCTGVDATTSNELFRIASTSVYSLVNIGIGTATANAQLQLGNTVTRRKIVLFEGTNNDYQFIGFGIGGGNTLIHTVGASGGSHVFTAASSATAATELMRITGTGFVGIGTGTPNAPLQFSTGIRQRTIVLSELAVNSQHQFNGFGLIDDSTIKYHIASTSGSHIFYGGISDTNSNELFRIAGTYVYTPGKIGIGTDIPNAPLQFSNANNSRKIVLSEVVNNNHQFNGFGFNTGDIVRYQVASTTGVHRFHAGVDSASSNELMRITGAGYVGIGTGAPNAPLQFANAAARRKVVLTETANNDYQFTGLGVVGGALIYNTGTAAAHVFTTAASATAATELMRITPTGEIISPYIYSNVPRIVYWMVNNVLNVSSVSGTWFKIPGATIIPGVSSDSYPVLFTHSDNRATYIGGRGVNMVCNVSATVFNSSATAADVSIAIFKNGIRVIPSQMTNAFNTANFRQNFNTQIMLPMATDDYLEVFIMCNVSGITLNTPFLTLTAYKI